LAVGRILRGEEITNLLQMLGLTCGTRRSSAEEPIASKASLRQKSSQPFAKIVKHVEMKMEMAESN
jgi:hypothetical protein